MRHCDSFSAAAASASSLLYFESLEGVVTSTAFAENAAVDMASWSWASVVSEEEDATVGVSIMTMMMMVVTEREIETFVVY